LRRRGLKSSLSGRHKPKRRPTAPGLQVGALRSVRPPTAPTHRPVDIPYAKPGHSEM
jgi:hypothetical protein